MKKNKKFYAIPRNAGEMTDEEINAWAKTVYESFVKGETAESQTTKKSPDTKKNGGKK